VRFPKSTTIPHAILKRPIARRAIPYVNGKGVLKMTAQIETFPTTSWPRPGPFHRLRAHFGAVNAAHEAGRRHLAVTDRDFKDAGMSRDEVVGIPSYQPDLPFFMQHGFQAHRD
jgi:hypothetical protein